MIDIKAFRHEPQPFLDGAKRKGAFQQALDLLNADEEWRTRVASVDDLRARQKIDGKPTPAELERLQEIKRQLKSAETELADAAARRDELLQQVPNPPHESVPDEDDAIRHWSEPPRLEHLKDHLDLGRFDMERAAKVSGTRFGYWVGDTALLVLALYRFALDRLVARGFLPVLPPVLVREEAMYGTGFFPSEKHDYYEVPADGLFLVGTSEVPLAGLHMGEILEELPLRYCAFSSCFRREAGAAGRDTHGMFRVHQFEKVEMFVWCPPEESWDEHERLLAIEEELVQELGLPYRVLNIGAGDLSAAAAKRYDIEAWFPSQERYREITSCSNTTDYQARRLATRFRRDGKPETPHTLNGTAATGRWALAILENFQGEVPEPLRVYGAPATVSR
jgi:seryl-tRNA synthetase